MGSPYVRSVLIPGYGLVLFLPTIINGLGFSAANAQILSVPPNAAGCITTIVSGILSDKYRARGPFILAASVTSLAGYLTLITTSSPGAGYAGVMLVGLGVYPCVACILAWTGGNFGGETKKAVVIAMVIGLGNLGGCVHARNGAGKRSSLAFLTDLGHIQGCIVIRIPPSRQPAVPSGARHEHRVLMCSVRCYCCCTLSHISYCLFMCLSGRSILLTVIGMLEYLRQNRRKDAQCQNDGIATGSHVAREYAEMGDSSPLFRCVGRRS